MPAIPDDPTGPTPITELGSEPDLDLSPEQVAARAEWRATRRAEREVAVQQGLDRLSTDPALRREAAAAVRAAHAAISAAVNDWAPGLDAIAQNARLAAAGYSAAFTPIWQGLETRLIPLLRPTVNAWIDLLRSLLPPNLEPIRDQVNTRQVMVSVRDNGIPMWLVPSAHLALDVLAAPDVTAARAVLEARADDFFDDCAEVLDGYTDPAWADQVRFARLAVDAGRAGHVEAAQALAASVLDTLFNRWAPDRNDRLRLQYHGPSGDPPEEIMDADDVAFLFTWLPAWRAYESYWADRGDPIPNVFARHASAHGVSERQYTRTNCVQGCLVVVSVLGFLQGRSPRPIPPPPPEAETPRRRPHGKKGSSPTA